MIYEFDESQWSSVIIRPSLWWRIKALFKQPEIVFCWGQDRYMLQGFLGEERLSIGGVPLDMHERARHGGVYAQPSGDKQ